MLMDNQHKTNSSGIDLARKADWQGYIITREHKQLEQKSRTTDKSKKNLGYPLRKNQALQATLEVEHPAKEQALDAGTNPTIQNQILNCGQDNGPTVMNGRIKSLGFTLLFKNI